MKKFYFLFLATVCILACKKAPEEIAVSSVSLSQPTAEMLVGETVLLRASVQPSNATDKSIVWASSNQSVATVSDSGLVTAIAEGTATVSASAGGKSAFCTIQVSKKVVEVTSVELDQTELDLEEGQSATLVATVKPDDATNKSVSWGSSDETTATVDGNGTVSAVKEGTATITAKAGDKQAVCVVTVSKKVIAVESISLNKSKLELEKGESETLVATVKPDDATDTTVTWSSSAADIATVDQEGKVSAIKAGTAIITAKAGEQSVNCTVTVLSPLVTVVVSGRIKGLRMPETIQGVIPESEWASGLEIGLLCNNQVYRYQADNPGTFTSFSLSQGESKPLQARDGDCVYAIAPLQTITGSCVSLSNLMLPLAGNALSPLPLMTLRGVGTVNNGQVELEFESVYPYIVLSMGEDDRKLFSDEEYARVYITNYRTSSELFFFDLITQIITFQIGWAPYSEFNLISNVFIDGKSYTYFPILPGSIRDTDLNLFTAGGKIAWSHHFTQLDFQSNNVYLIDFDKSAINGADGSFSDVPIINW